MPSLSSTAGVTQTPASDPRQGEHQTQDHTNPQAGQLAHEQGQLQAHQQPHEQGDQKGEDVRQPREVDPRAPWQDPALWVYDPRRSIRQHEPVGLSTWPTRERARWWAAMQQAMELADERRPEQEAYAARRRIEALERACLELEAQREHPVREMVSLPATPPGFRRWKIAHRVCFWREQLAAARRRDARPALLALMGAELEMELASMLQVWSLELEGLGHRCQSRLGSFAASDHVMEEIAQDSSRTFDLLREAISAALADPVSLSVAQRMARETLEGGAA